ncbi:MAG: acylphosphatase [Alphaproteobacteria bacterium]
MSSSEQTHFRLRIAGRVQGVGFRDWLLGEARARGLNGWVRNRSDGTVEALVSGPDAAVQDILRACTQGPPAASVTGIDIKNEKDPAPEGFLRRPNL